MNQFDDREKAEERKFASKEELEFKVQAKRNRMIGAWAANLLGLVGEDADKYATSVVIADLKEAGDEDVYQKLASDFAAANIDVSEHQIRREMAELLDKARAELGA